MSSTILSRSETAPQIHIDEPHSLEVFFSPKSVAVIGATENPGAVGRTVLENLIGTPFGGVVFPVNPKRKSVLGIKAYPTIGDVPDAVDLAIIATPAKTVPGLVAQCVADNVRGAIILSAGFTEAGEEGAERNREILAEVRKSGMRIVGPNCLGVMAPHSGLNASFASGMAYKGKVALLSQSGALGTAILDWSLKEHVGFSAFVSLGSMLDVSWGDLIDYLAADPKTESVLCYMESVGDARRFLSAAREAAFTKPILVLKAGRTDAGAKAASSHTGTLAGSDNVLEAAFQRSGVLRVNTIAELFYMAEVLGEQPLPRGPRLTVLTNAGGPAVLAADTLVECGGTLASLSPETTAALTSIMPAHSSVANPVDILGDADAERYARTAEIAVMDPNSDGLLVILTPQAMTDPTGSAETLSQIANTGKPILASWMGGNRVARGVDILHQHGIPVFPYPDTAALAVCPLLNAGLRARLAKRVAVA